MCFAFGCSEFATGTISGGNRCCRTRGGTPSRSSRSAPPSQVSPRSSSSFIRLPGTSTRDPRLLALAIVTILLSWTFIHTIFTLHYAHEYYADRRGNRRGLDFPGDEKPGYWDFVYFSFVIGMTSQVSDVCVTSSNIRQIVAAHGLVSFVYNVALLALTINIAASAM